MEGKLGIKYFIGRTVYIGPGKKGLEHKGMASE